VFTPDAVPGGVYVSCKIMLKTLDMIDAFGPAYHNDTRCEYALVDNCGSDGGSGGGGEGASRKGAQMEQGARIFGDPSVNN